MRDETDWQDTEQLRNQGVWMRLGARAEGRSQLHYLGWQSGCGDEGWGPVPITFQQQTSLLWPQCIEARSQKQRSLRSEGDHDSQPERQCWGAGGSNPPGSLADTTRAQGLKSFGQKEERKTLLIIIRKARHFLISIENNLLLRNKNCWPTNCPHCYIFH